MSDELAGTSAVAADPSYPSDFDRAKWVYSVIARCERELGIEGPVPWKPGMPIVWLFDRILRRALGGRLDAHLYEHIFELRKAFASVATVNTDDTGPDAGPPAAA